MSTTSSSVLNVSSEARAIVVEALSAEPDAADLALVVEIRGVNARGYDYDLYFQPVAELPEGASLEADDELRIAVPEDSRDRLLGARLEVEDGGLVLVNPNNPSPAEMHPSIPEHLLGAPLDGPMAQTVTQVLDAEVNPSIASHGGRADLVAFDEEQKVAYLALSGGCQGCAMSRMTLSNGIEVALKEAIPDLAGVIDVTDHASGSTPFYS